LYKYFGLTCSAIQTVPVSECCRTPRATQRVEWRSPSYTRPVSVFWLVLTLLVVHHCATLHYILHYVLYTLHATHTVYTTCCTHYMLHTLYTLHVVHITCYTHCIHYMLYTLHIIYTVLTIH